MKYNPLIYNQGMKKVMLILAMMLSVMSVNAQFVII